MGMSACEKSYAVLITDDDEPFRETLREILEPAGFRTYLAGSGEEALDLAHCIDLHLALLDQNLPRLSGLETLRLLRKMNLLMPVILMTAHRTEQLIREAMFADAFCVMTKPFDRGSLLAEVRDALRQSRKGPERPQRRPPPRLELF